MLKKDDLCRVVAPYTEQGRGSFVTLLSRHNLYEGLVAWQCSGWVRNSSNTPIGPLVMIDETCLQRVDPGDGEDEINRIAGRPAEGILKECDRLIQEFNQIVEQAERLK